MMGWPPTPEEQKDWMLETMQALPAEPLPDRFDPRTADPDDLCRLGFPPRPDPETQRALYEAWLELFALPLEFEQGVLKDEIDFALPDEFQSVGRVTAPSRHEASLNWSGAYITPRDGRMFTDVVGSFRVPRLSPPPDLPTVTEFRCSTWIGLDGQRRYLDSTLPQLGTAVHLRRGDRDGGTASAWIQWWPLAAITFTTFGVLPTHRMLCWLHVPDPLHVIGAIRNMDTRRMRMFKMRAPKVVEPPRFPDPIQVTVSGATAEWVVERPAHRRSPRLYDLPDYREVVFKRCYAVAGPGPGAAGRVETLVGPNLICMYRIAEQPHRSVTISVAERLGYDRIRTRYGG